MELVCFWIALATAKHRLEAGARSRMCRAGPITQAKTARGAVFASGGKQSRHFEINLTSLDDHTHAAPHLSCLGIHHQFSLFNKK